MSNGTIAGFAANVLGISQQDIQALNAVASVIGAISSVWGYVNTVKSVLTTLGVFPDPNNPNNLANAIRAAVDQLESYFGAVIAELEQEDTMRDLEKLKEQARTALELLRQNAPDDATAADWPDRDLVDRDSLLVVNTLGGQGQTPPDQSYWLRIFHPELVYSPQGPYSGVPPREPSGLVFDYRLTLPAYLEAISIRLTILAAITKDPANATKDELNDMAVTLAFYFNKIRQGITELGPPAADWAPPGWTPGDYDIPTWEAQGAPFGAMEVFSTFHVVDSWPGGFPLTGPAPQDPGAWGKFLVRHLVRTMTRWKQVYREIGLPATAATLLQLKTLAAISPAAIDGPTGDWSVQELTQRLSAIWETGITLGNGSQPISLRQILHVLQTFNPQPYESVRSALAQ